MSNGTIQTSGIMGMGGFCRPIARQGDLVRNSYQYYAPLNAGGWENGIIQDGASAGFVC
jgi:hypothetical protein